MRHINRFAFPAIAVSLLALALSGCGTTTTTPVTYQDTPYGTVAYPEGTYKMYGDGTTTAYYWVWVPKGSSQPVLAPPPVLPPNQPAAVVQSGVPGVMPTVVAPPPQSVAAGNGRYQLYGNGTTQPYYWVWVPTGVPPPRRRHSRAGNTKAPSPDPLPPRGRGFSPPGRGRSG